MLKTIICLLFDMLVLSQLDYVVGLLTLTLSKTPVCTHRNSNIRTHETHMKHKRSTHETHKEHT